MSHDASRTHEDALGSQNGGGVVSQGTPGSESGSQGNVGVLGGRTDYPTDGGRLEGSSGLRQLAQSQAVHTRPYGARDAFARAVHGLVAAHKEAVVADLTTPENTRAWLETLMAGVRAKDRTCVNLYAKVTGLAEVQDALVAEFLARVGAATLDHVEEKLQRIQDAATLTAEQRAAACAEYLELFLNKYPEQRQQIVRRLGGMVEVRSDSFARVVPDGPGQS